VWQPCELLYTRTYLLLTYLYNACMQYGLTMLCHHISSSVKNCRHHTEAASGGRSIGRMDSATRLARPSSVLRNSISYASVAHTHMHTHLTALFPVLPEWAGTRKVKPIWILLNQETVSGIGISWDICKSAPHSRQITTPAPHSSVFFYRPDALPAAQPTASKH